MKKEKVKEYIFFHAMAAEGFRTPKDPKKDTAIKRLYDEMNKKDSTIDKIITAICKSKSSIARNNALESGFFKDAVYNSTKMKRNINHDAVADFLNYASSGPNGLDAYLRRTRGVGQKFPSFNTYRQPVFTTEEMDAYQQKNLGVIEKGVAAKQFTDGVDKVQIELGKAFRYMLEDNRKRQEEAKTDPKKKPSDSYQKLIDAIKNLNDNMPTGNPQFIHGAMTELKEATENYKNEHNAVFRLTKGRARRNAASAIANIVERNLSELEIAFKEVTGENMQRANSPTRYDIQEEYTKPYELYKGKLDCMRMVNENTSKITAGYQKMFEKKGADNNKIAKNILSTRITAEQMREKIINMDPVDAPVIQSEIKNRFSQPEIEARGMTVGKTGHFKNYMEFSDGKFKQESYKYIKEFVHCKENKLSTDDIPKPSHIRESYNLEKSETEYTKKNTASQRLMAAEEMNNQKKENQRKYDEEMRKLEEEKKLLQKQRKKRLKEDELKRKQREAEEKQREKITAEEKRRRQLEKGASPSRSQSWISVI
ncbi:MAG: hypothetical protein K6G82_08850 [Ruminococcus sp.]|nr:hypothetical protein [Ruminococcus sp.]